MIGGGDVLGEGAQLVGPPVGLRRVGRSEQGDNAGKDMDSSPTNRSSRARDSLVIGMAMRPRSSPGGHEESSAPERSTASSVQWGAVTEAAVASNREQPVRGRSGVCDVSAANVMKEISRSRKRKSPGGGNAAVILPPDEVGDRCSQGQPAAGGVHFRWVNSGYTFVGLMLHDECRVKHGSSKDRTQRKLWWVHSKAVQKGGQYAAPRLALAAYMQRLQPTLHFQVLLTEPDGTCIHQLARIIPECTLQATPAPRARLKELEDRDPPACGELSDILLLLYRIQFDAGLTAIVLGAISWYAEDEEQAGSALYVLRVKRVGNDQITMEPDPDLIAPDDVARCACICASLPTLPLLCTLDCLYAFPARGSLTPPLHPPPPSVVSHPLRGLMHPRVRA